jgi:hypothetical protein
MKRKSLTPSVLYLLAFLQIACYAAARTQGGSDPNKAFLDVNDIAAKWKLFYGNDNLRFSKAVWTEKILELVSDDPNQKDRMAWYVQVVRLEDKPFVYDKTVFDNEDGSKTDKSRNNGEESFDGNESTVYYPALSEATIYPRFKISDFNYLKYYMFMSDPNIANSVSRYFDVKKVFDTAKVLPNLETVSGYPCHVVQYTYTTIWFAHEKSMLPLRFKLDWGNFKEDFLVEKISSVETPKGTVWYPVRIKLTETSKPEFTKRVKQFDVKEFKCQYTPMNKASFKIKLPPGTVITDTVRGFRYIKDINDVSQLQNVRKLRVK